MALTDTKLRRLKPKAKPYSEADGGGLFVEVMPSGKLVWRMRYRLGGRGSRQEKVTLGEYPSFSLTEARQWREECRIKIAHGESPMHAKRDEKARSVSQVTDTVSAFAEIWFANVVEKTNKSPVNIRRVLDKDVLPAIGNRQLAEVTVTDVMNVTDQIKARGADQMALQTRNVMKRLFAYAIARQKLKFNPAAAIEARYIATARSRDVALSPEEIGRLLRGIYTSSLKRQHKLALHLLILCMARKSELREARWTELDLEHAEWLIPADRMKMGKAHIVPLSRQAVAMFEELQALACGSEWVLPSRNSLKRCLAHNTLNKAVQSLGLEIQDFVIHDFRRTASTILNESGFNSDWIEKALAHEQGGPRGVYNMAQYLPQRREMLQWWADFVDAQVDEGRNVILGRFGRMSRAA